MRAKNANPTRSPAPDRRSPRGPAALAVVMLVLCCAATSSAQGWQTYEASTTLISDWPDQLQAGWTDECQGVTHDADHWYFTHGDPLEIWKIHVSYDLADAQAGWSGVTVAGVPAQLSSAGYNHYGDPSYYHTGTRGYVIVPIEGGPCLGLAVFRAADLSYVTHACMPNAQAGSSWCAIDPSSGHLYGVAYCGSLSDPLCEYSIDWDLLDSQGMLALTLEREIVLKDESGANYMLLKRQGGAVTPSGRYIFISCGNLGDFSDYVGLHVFDLETGWRIDRSQRGWGRFNFDFDPTDYPGEMEEPEGMTIWDLDDGRAPNIYGQLHVVLLDNDEPSDDDVYLKHYRETIYVDASHEGGTGIPSNPYSDGVAVLAGAWRGSRVLFRGGCYPGTVTVDELIRVEHWYETSAFIGTGVPPAGSGEGRHE